MSSFPSILVVDDHQIVFSGIQLIFHTQNLEFDLKNCKNGDDCMEKVKNQFFDLIIMDVNLPDTDTFQLVGLIKNLYPQQKILMFSMSVEEMYAKHFLRLGALGFVSKQASNEEFVSAVKKVIAGEVYLSDSMLKTVTNEAIHGKSKKLFEKLSPREFEIMTYFLNGNGSKEVANMTHLHSSTIGTYKFKIMDKLGVKNLLELQDLARINGIIS